MAIPDKVLRGIRAGDDFKSFKSKYTAKTFHKYKRHGRVQVDDYRIDIIIPFHSQYDSVRKLVKSILECTRSNPYQITLVDDCSPNNDFVDIISQAPQTQCIRLDEHSGFGAAIHAGFQATEQPYVCFLNSDCLVQNPNWLETMGQTLVSMKQYGVRLVSARSDNPVSDIELLKGGRYDSCEDTIVDEALPLFCFMCHRGLFDRIGGFIKHYPYGGFEDEELFWRMKKYGYKQAIAGKSWIHHEGEKTIRYLCMKNPPIKEAMMKNRELCINDIRSLK